MSESPAQTEPDPRQAAGYYGHLRTDVLALLPGDLKEVVSVGCGGGATEAELIGRGAKVVGVEMDAEAAEAASGRGLEMIVGDAHAGADRLAARSFDAAVFADVLEHIADADAVLARYAQLLRPGGLILISVPNFRRWSVAWELLVRGEPPYTDSGIFDRTHVRLTTRKLVERWMRGAGAAVETVDYRLWHKRDRLAAGLTLGLGKPWLAQQVIVVGRMPG